MLTFSLLLEFLLQPFTKSYTILKDIGSGSFGTVLLTRHKESSRFYAAKFIKHRKIKEWAGSVPLEVHILSRLQHNNVVGYAGCCKLPEHWVLIMDYLEQCVDLGNYIRLRGGPLPEPLARLILVQTHDALGYCLSRGVDHRDVKCQNILIDTSTFQIRLIDFGLASLCDKNTVYTTVRGTGLYLPPEALVQQRYTPLEALSWAFGCLLFCMVTARNPFNSKKDVVFGEQLLPHQLSPNCKSLLNGLLEKPFTKSYTILKDIGSGSFGTVLLTRHKESSRFYAAKFIKHRKIKEWAGSVPLEVHILSRLQHNNVVGYAGCCKLPEHWVLIMDYLEQCVDLGNYIRLRGGPLPEPLARLILVQTHDALGYCLSRGVDHRDVKCQNILIDTSTFQIRLIDFGLASLCDKNTVYTTVRGTGLYLPPEALVQQRYTPLEALSWAFGCLLFCMVTARNPFNSKKDVVFGEQLLPHQLSPNCKSLLNGLLEKPFTKSYTILKDIGSGSFGTVLLTRHKESSRFYAAKFIKHRKIKEWAGSVPLEVHILSRLQHNNVVGYAGCCKLPEHWVLIMDYLEQCVDLGNYIRLRGGPLPEPLARLILVQTHDALGYCLSRGVDHRDVKCQNILIDTSTFQIRLIDFGLASLCDKNTVYTTVRGTGLYLPPEALVQQRYTPLEALSWAFGCLLFCMVTARNPFNSKKDVVFGEPLSPHQLSPNCKSLLNGLLEKVRHKRVQFETIVWHPWFQEVFSSDRSTDSSCITAHHFGWTQNIQRPHSIQT
eukprot:sb/3462300/